MTYDILIQTFGFIAFAISLFSYQIRDQRKLFALRALADIIWSLHYFFLGALTASFCIFIAVFRTFFAIFIFEKHKLFIVILSAILVILFCSVSYDGELKVLLPALGAVIYGVSTYYYKSYNISRSCMFMGTMIWLTIGISYGSWAEVISSLLNICSLMLAYYRHTRIRVLSD